MSQNRVAELRLTIVLGVLAAFGPLSIDMYLPSLPAIRASLHTTTSSVQLTLASFMAGMGIGQIVYGPLSDRLGRRAPLFWGIGVYVAASVGCAAARDVSVLVGLRFLQAIGGASGPVIARAVVRDLFAGKDVARQLSVMVLIAGAAPILAPIFGGFVLGHWGWRAIFWTLAALGTTAGVSAWLALPRSPSRPRGKLAASLVVLARDRRFVVSTLGGSFAQSALFAYIASAPFVFMGLFHFSPREFALLFGMNASGFIGASQLNRRLLARFSVLDIARSATLCLGLAHVALLWTVFAGEPRALPLAAAVFACVACLGLILPNAAAIALEHHPTIAGLASSVLGAAQFGAGALAAAVAGGRGSSAGPMASTMALSAAAALASMFALRRETQPQLAAADE